MVSLCMLPGPQRLAASCDSSGACRVWSGVTGAGLCCFAEPGNLAAQATHSVSAWGRQSPSGECQSRCTMSALCMRWLHITCLLEDRIRLFQAKRAYSAERIDVPCCR